MGKRTDVQALLQAALDATPEHERPAPPFHAGGAKPVLGGFGCTGVALFAADSVAERVTFLPGAERASFDAWVTGARDIYDRHARGEAKDLPATFQPQPRSLDRAAYDAFAATLSRTGNPNLVDWESTDLPPLLRIANGAALAALALEVRLGGTPPISAAKTAVTVAASHIRSREFIEQLDLRMLREELRTMLTERRDERAARVTSCLWRAADTDRDTRKTTHWLGELDGGELVLVFKAGRAWTIFSGARDDVLNTVPDAHLEAAVAAALGPSRSR